MQDSAAPMPDDGIAFEVVIVKPKAGTSMEEFLAGDATMAKEFVAAQPGFLDREVGVSRTGEVLVIVRWASLKDAEAAGEAFMAASSGQAGMEKVDVRLFAHFIKQ